MLDVDLVDPSTYSSGVPHEVFDELRDRGRVVFHGDSMVGPYWSITGHKELQEASRAPHIFCNQLGRMFQDTPETLELRRDNLSYLDPPRHTEVRNIVKGAFGGSSVARLEDSVRTVIRESISRVRDRDRFDLPTELTLEIPLRVIAQMLGLAEVDRPAFIRWTSETFADPRTPDGRATALRAQREIFALAWSLAEEKRRHPADDLGTAMVQAMDSEVGLSDREYEEMFAGLVFAGYETTRNVFSHGVIRLIQDRELREELTSNGAIIPTFVEEQIRHDPPLLCVVRHVTEDTDFYGHAMKKGDLVSLWIVAANRDPQEFDDPHGFDPRRSPNRHSSFGGGGPHFCLGALLARLEGRIFFEEMAPLVARLELAEPPTPNTHPDLNVIARAPMRWRS